MAMPKNRKTKPTAPAQKSMKMGADELGDMIKNAVKEALGESAAASDDEAGGDDVATVVQEIIADVLEDRKARKEDGEEIDEESLGEEIAEAIAATLGGEGDDEEKGDDEEDEEEKSSDGREEPRDEGDEGKRKGGRKPTQRKSTPARRSTPAPSSRKYSDIYVPRSGPSFDRDQKKLPPEIALARAVKCLDVFQAGSPRKDPERAAYFAKSIYGDQRMEREFKALSATVPSTGGFLIPEVYLDEIVELLYAKTVLFELGARKVPLTNGNLNIPKMTSGARATWGGEGRKIAKSQPAFGNIKLSAKRLEAIVPQTRELLMSTNYSADAIFAQDLTRRMQLGLDWGGLFGKGGEFQPVGVMNTPGIMQIDATKLNNTALADATGKLTSDFPVHVRSAVLAKNVDDLALGWTFNSMMEGFLMNLKTSTGAYIYREEMQGGKLLGFPYKVSNQIGTDDANKTSMFFGNWADLLVGEQLGLETYTTLDGSWTDEDGVTHNAFEENLAATRALMYDDIAVRHAESFAYVKNCKIA